MTTMAGGHKHDEKKMVAKLDAMKIDIVEAVALAQKETAGTVIEAELESEGGNLVWEIKLLDESMRKIKYQIDATSGELMMKRIGKDKHKAKKEGQKASKKYERKY